MSNKVLFIVLAALVGIFVLSKFLKGDRSRSFEPLVVQIDTASVNRIEVTRKAEPGVMITLNRVSGRWTVSNGKITDDAPAANVSSTLNALTNIRTERIVARSPEKWPQYEVGAEASTIKVWSGDKAVVDLVIGGFKFDQARRSASTYIRRSGEDDVYLVEGFLAMQLTQGMDSYRNNMIVKSSPADVTRVEYTLLEDAYVLTRELEGGWYFAGMESIDSTAMAGYLNGIANLTSREFGDGLNAGAEATRTLRISGNNMDPVDVKLFSLADTAFIVNSSLNPNAYFTSDSTGVFKKLFGDLDRLLQSM